MNLEIVSRTEIGPSDFTWWGPPQTVEHFDRTWECEARIDGRSVRIRHGIGRRNAYGRDRVHSVTWLEGQPTVEGVEADDYAETRSLISAIKRPDRKLARSLDEVPEGYEGFLIINHREEIDAKYSRDGLAVKIREDDADAWCLYAALRKRDRAAKTPGPTPTAAVRRKQIPSMLPPSYEPITEKTRSRVARALIEYEEHLNGPLQQGTGRLTEDEEADRFVHQDGFAFLLAVLFDQGIGYGRAWGAPFELRRRLGHLDPHRMVREPDAVAEAIRRRPALHRYVNTLPVWVLEAARRVIDQYKGRAENIWDDRPTARGLQARLDAFLGVSQKKAAMTAMLLWRNRDVDIREMDGCDVAVDIHIRRVFLRTGLVERDDPREMIQSARRVWPALPGALDPPAWTIGRERCHAGVPDCPACPIRHVCPKLVDRAASVVGA
ncbi:MAG: hypothetical protein L0206_13275 [Actinobacteria bacterium]|nr:hypothetical protein [Actinomycetota bacterium]